MPADSRPRSAARPPASRPGYVDPQVSASLAARAQAAGLDPGKLTRLIAELNDNYSQGNAYAAHALLRAILDHIPPLLGCADFKAAASSYLQDNRCFYCGQTFNAALQADHFIPRVRCGIDTVENLVLADRRCNNDKRDLLPGLPYVTARARRNQRYGGALADLAAASRWDSAREATVAVARSIYSHLPPGGTPLWLGFKRSTNCPSRSPGRPGLDGCRTQSTLVPPSRHPTRGMLGRCVVAA